MDTHFFGTRGYPPLHLMDLSRRSRSSQIPSTRQYPSSHLCIDHLHQAGRSTTILLGMVPYTRKIVRQVMFPEEHGLVRDFIIDKSYHRPKYATSQIELTEKLGLISLLDLPLVGLSCGRHNGQGSSRSPGPTRDSCS